MAMLNATHDPERRSWVASANVTGSDFPIQNLPFGLFKRAGETPRGGVAVGDQIFDLKAGVAAGLFSGEALKAASAASEETLNALLALGNGPASALRARLSDLLRSDGPERAKVEAMAATLLVPQADVELLLPARVTQFTDMCISTFHAGRARGNDERGQPITAPMFRWLPVAYNGRASSVVVSGTPVKRPNGEWQADENDLTPPPNFGPEPRQDYELEFGAWIAGAGNGLGTAIAITDAPDHIFGHSIVNDWSSRGIQRWETMLGPFLGKSLSTTVSPWIVTAEALAPFHAPAFKRPEGDPPILPYLLDPTDQAEGGLDIVLEAFILTPKMRAAGDAPAKICSTNFKYMYWTWAQMLTHHSSNGCPLGPGDLIASGTCSGPAIEEAACLAETSDRGTKAWSLPNGETRTYLEDGDEVILRGQARRAGFVSIGFGENAGRLDPAVPWPTSLARAAE